MGQLDTLAGKAADAAKEFTISMFTMAMALAIATANNVSAYSASVPCVAMYTPSLCTLSTHLCACSDCPLLLSYRGVLNETSLRF